VDAVRTAKPVDTVDAVALATPAALEFIDEPTALVDEQPIATDELWRSILAAAGRADAIVVPSWWSTARRELLRRCAPGPTRIVSRADDADAAAMIEVGPELVYVSPGPVVFARNDIGVARRAADAVAGFAEVALHAPGDAGLAAQITAALGSEVVVTDRTDAPTGRPPRRRRRRWPVAVAVIAIAAVCAAPLIRQRDRPPAEPPVSLLVEGRVGVTVPADWSMQRITAGPGSARLQVVSSRDADLAVHVTQAAVTPGETVAATGEVLRVALDQQPPGVFVDFDAAAVRAGRHAVSYREVRPGRQIVWTVFVDGGVRIGIGCQSAPEAADAVRDVCDRAVATAHAVF
jgi:type VII secretion-associated protein (TIGR03931 family)